VRAASSPSATATARRQVARDGGRVVALGNLEAQLSAERVAVVADLLPSVPEPSPGLHLLGLQAGGARCALVQPAASSLALEDAGQLGMPRQHLVPLSGEVDLEVVARVLALAGLGQRASDLLDRLAGIGQQVGVGGQRPREVPHPLGLGVVVDRGHRLAERLGDRAGGGARRVDLAGVALGDRLPLAHEVLHRCVFGRRQPGALQLEEVHQRGLL
jgi:hypothetical protein